MSAERVDRRPEAARQSGSSGRPSGEPDAPLVSDWLRIEADGTVTVFTGKAEVGQSIRTSLAQAVADELRLPIAAIQLVMADTDLTPFDAGTFGSQTTPRMAPQLRRAAATARELLIAMAAARWQLPPGELHVGAGKVCHPASGHEIGFGALAGGQQLDQLVREDAPLTPAEDWTAAGVSAPRVDAVAIVTGQRRYTPDLTRPGTLWGKLLRPPAFGATLLSLDTRAAEALPDVTVVREGEFVGVVAPQLQQALRGLQALRAEWSTTEQVAGAELFSYLRSHPAPPSDSPRGAPVAYVHGSVATGQAAADVVLEQTYTNAYIAHAPLEPRAALAEWDADRLTVWTGTQRPFGVRSELAAAFGLSEEQIRVIVPDTGAAYGGKHTGDAAIEAARLARLAGRPVKLVWSRQEEFTWAYFRPAGVIDVRGAVRADGTLLAWEFDTYNAGAAGIGTPYAVEHQRIAFHPSLSPLRQGSYRALAATANNFARESHMDELAQAIDMDPLAFRLHNLQDARLRAVLEAAAAHFGWGRAAALAGRGYGIACGTEKGGYVATCVEVEVSGDPAGGQLRVLRVVQAFECGAIVNPDGLRNQVEGAIIQGLGGALYEAIDFADGRILNDRFSAYRVPRFADIPPIETLLLDRKDLPSAGAGETPIIGIAPAIANAVYAASGVRLRSLPLLSRPSPGQAGPAG